MRKEPGDADTSVRIYVSGHGCLSATIAVFLALLMCANWWTIGAAITRWLEP